MLDAIYLPVLVSTIGTFAINVIGGVAGGIFNIFGYYYPIKIPI